MRKKKKKIEENCYHDNQPPGNRRRYFRMSYTTNIPQILDICKTTTVSIRYCTDIKRASGTAVVRVYH
jgi:hypothetical protein